MKATGIVRRVDELGRIVMPIELRRTLDMEVKDEMEIFVEGERVILRKYNPACVFCGELEGAITFRGKLVCESCRTRLHDDLASLSEQ